MVQSALLPLVTASAIAGALSANTQIDPVFLPPSDVRTEVGGAAVILSATWLLFDFGENVSRRQAADQFARVAGLAFNRTKNASDRLAAAKLEVSIARAVTSGEVALAYEALRTALVVTDASFANFGEFAAIEAKADARATVYQAAAALALASGFDS